MRAEDRQNYILAIANEVGYVSIIEAARHLEVSTETVRRDIQKLSEKSLLKKVRGGASPVKPSFRNDGAYVWRMRYNKQKRMALGLEAAKMVKSNMVVAFSTGTSIQAIAACISDVENVTFVTHSIPTAAILLDRIESGEISGKVIMLGGELDAHDRFSFGNTTINEIDRIHYDIAFVACTAFSSSGASVYLSNTNHSVHDHFMRQANVSVLVAGSYKMGKVSTYRFAALNEFDRIITDNQTPVPKEILELINESKTELTIVEIEK